MTKMIKKSSILAAVACISLIAASCGEDEEIKPAQTVDPPPTKVTDPPPQATTTQSIVDVAASNPDFSMLVKAVQRAGLVDTLESKGPFTVFAPDNNAFMASGISDVDAVPVDQLKTILLYHVIGGAAVGSADVSAGPVVSAADLTLFLGTTAGVIINGGNAITGGANVTSTDLKADNGLIHVIDRVILPPDIPTAAIYGGLTSLVGAVSAAADLPDGTSVMEALQGEGPFTVFAPTDEAFAGITAPGDPVALRDILLYHVVAGAVPSTEIPAMASSLLTNRWGNPLTLIFNSAAGVKVNMSEVVVADIKTTNGIVHLINKVLLPPNIIDMAGIAGLQALAGAIGAAADLPGGVSIAEALQADEPYTVFTPTDAAFGDIMAPTDAAVLRDVLLLHVVNAGTPVLSSGLPSSSVEALSGGELTFEAGGPAVSSGGTMSAMIGPYDINVTNGVIHVIDKVLLP